MSFFIESIAGCFPHFFKPERCDVQMRFPIKIAKEAVEMLSIGRKIDIPLSVARRQKR